MRDRKGNRPQCAGRLDHVQPELILVWFYQRRDGLVEQLVVGQLLGSEAVAVMRLLTQPQRSEQRDNPPQPLLQDRDRSDQPLLKAQARIDLGKRVTGALAVEGILDDGIDQVLLGGKGPEDGALGDACCFGDLPGAHLAAETFQQRLRRGDERGSTVIEGQRRGTSHRARLVSEHSLNKGLGPEKRAISDQLDYLGPLCG